ncbi:MAG: GMC family oxidoreductase [Pseudomonadota bacterium]
MKVLVIGGGTAGCAFAGALLERSSFDVTLVEAGPDYGPFDAHRWPAELLDSRRLASSHDWGLAEASVAPRHLALERARVLGGCSAHNGCAIIRGPASDYQRWAEVTGDPHWLPDALEEDFSAVEAALEVRQLPMAEVTPFQRDLHAAALAAGYPALSAVGGYDQKPGVAIWPMNKRGGVRWNAAFAFLDPHRSSGRLTILDQTEVHRLLVEGESVVGVEGRRQGEDFSLKADLVVLSAGAYGSPMLLQASGIGDPDQLAAAGIACRHALPGVGKGLQDHPSVVLRYQASAALEARMEAFEAGQLAYDEGAIVTLASRQARDPVDLHLVPAAGHDGAGDRYWEIGAALLTPRSKGQVRPLAGGDVAIEHDYLSDPEGHDLACLLDGIAAICALVREAPLSEGLTAPVSLADSVEGVDLSAWVKGHVQHYWHPAGSCAMGRSAEEGAVVDGKGRLLGLEGCIVADCAIMPGVPAANTNLPAALVGRRLARFVG